jgi:hypothetical protein
LFLLEYVFNKSKCYRLRKYYVFSDNHTAATVKKEKKQENIVQQTNKHFFWGEGLLE